MYKRQVSVYAEVVLTSGTLPTGVSWRTTDRGILISGTPTTDQTQSAVVWTATNEEGSDTLTANFIVGTAAILRSNTQTLPIATSISTYTFNLDDLLLSSSPQPVWDAMPLSGRLPTGLTLSASARTITKTGTEDIQTGKRSVILGVRQLTGGVVRRESLQINFDVT